MSELEGIYGFQGDYRWLSNMWLCDVIWDDLHFPSSEQAYVYAKLGDNWGRDNGWDEYNNITRLSPRQSKVYGHTQIKCREDWDLVKLKVMEEVLTSKFINNEYLRLKLFDTKDLYLEETNAWKDTFLGVYNGVGKNHLGKLLMKLRNELKWI